LGKLLDLKDQVFGKLTVLERDYSRTNRVYWWCQCSCENKTIKSIATDELRKGDTTSCGCLKIVKAIEKLKKYDSINVPASFKIGAKMSDIFPHYKRLYSIYDGMKKRCYNIKKDNYEHYGGRGITICDEWLNDFMCFYNWAVDNGYSDELTIDRIDPDGNYNSSNCRWATQEMQDYNKRDTVYLVVDGESKTILEWEKISGLSWSVLWQRYNKYDMNTKRKLFKPILEATKIIHNNEETTFSKLSKETEIGVETLRKRYKRGLRDDELTKLVRKQKIEDTVDTREEVSTIG